MFYHFNNLRRDLGEDTYKIRHTIVSDNHHALEVLNSKDWPYFIIQLLEVSSGDIPLLDLSGISQKQKEVKELNIVYYK